MKSKSPNPTPVAASPSSTRLARGEWLALLVGVLAVPLLLAAPWLIGSAPDTPSKEQQARRERLANMSAAERNRLETNVERFHALPAERQEALLALHETVANEPKLQETLLEYERWLGTLTPWQRAELRNAADATRKMELVNTILTERRQLVAEFNRRENEWRETVKKYLTNFQGQGRKPESVRLSDNDLSDMVAVLEPNLPPGTILQTNTLPGCAAYNVQVLAAMLKVNSQQRPKEFYEEPLPKPLVQQMIAQVTDSRVRSELEESDEEDKGTRDFVKLVAWKLEMAWWNEAKQQYPSREELDAKAKMLGGKVLADFEERKKDNPNRAYFFLLMALRPADFHRDTHDLREWLDKLDLTRRPSWSHRPGGNGSSRGGGSFPSRGRESLNDQ